MSSSRPNSSKASKKSLDSCLYPELSVNRRRKLTAPAAVAAASAKKRTSTDAQLEDEDNDDDDNDVNSHDNNNHNKDLDNDKENNNGTKTQPRALYRSKPREPPTKNCDEVRQEIRDLIDSKMMPAGAFQSAINVSAKSYRDFMSQSGPHKGSRSATYINAAEWFRCRRDHGIVRQRPALTVDESLGNAAAATVTAPATATAIATVTKKRAKKVSATTVGSGRGSRAAEQNSEYDVSGITLEDESDDELEVPVFETCDRVRHMIREHVQKPGVTKAGFLRDAARAAFPMGGKTINSGLLHLFLKQEGALVGNTGMLFYAAYVFFEKLRIKNGEPKDDFRLAMEEIWPFGIERERPANGPWIVAADSQPYINEFGQVRIMRDYGR
ncbi:uncharacterized protein BP01DRAFT_353208 [Aspergillus saccharolyticus JOP 1030-1]|uniref:DUF7726 domain-containing protein n=1 Tax=Aspergillus saccharolyticus JOP 1030-1 TaxID=1450539 RepID=A0A319AR90_9EURO|nr:hypothetical protein BP01DRAFT_353208 [Aspergillus saccharolyticus JOP 1030-1]PYH48902.1 hypothetical protein BP01DRAFT_353208 [Aspergillus saccharolyticus JOP 1030-1]